MMNRQIDQVIQKTWQYWYVDGLVEIAGGVIVLLMAAIQVLLVWVEDGSTSAFVLGAGQPLILLLGMFLARWAVHKVKERLTFPRTGYVAYQQPKRQRRVLTMALAAGISILMVIGLAAILPFVGRNIVPAITGLSVFLFLSYIGWRMDLKRFYLVGALILLAGVAAVLLDLPENTGTILLLVVWGAAWLVSGWVTLQRYLTGAPQMDA